MDKGFDVESKDQDGWTSLMNAAYNGHTDIVKYLVFNGASVNVQDASQGTTALMNAALNDDIEIVEFLVGHHAR